MSSEKALPPCTVRVRRMTVNRLLQRKQFVIDVLHQGRRNVTKAELTEILAKMFHVTDPKTIFTYGFKTNFGGGRSVGFGLVYDNLQVAKRFEPKFRLVRAGLEESKKGGNRKLKKDARKKAKKQWGTRVKKSKDEKK